MCDIRAVHEPSGPPRSSERCDPSAAVLPPPRGLRTTRHLTVQTRGGGATWRRSIHTSPTPAQRLFVKEWCFATSERKGSSAGAYAETCTHPGGPQGRITVTGEHGLPQSQGALISMRGVRIE